MTSTEGDKKVFVPADALKAVLSGVREQQSEKRRLLARLEETRKRVQLLRSRSTTVESRLLEHRQSTIGHGGNGVFPKMGPKGLVGSQTEMSPVAAGSSEQASGGVVAMQKRVSQLEALMALAKEVSAQNSFESVIECTLRAAQQLVRADKFTLGILHERRNVLDICSISRNPADADVDLSFVKVNVINEGFVVPDSPTVFGRVIMTGRPFAINDLDTHAIFQTQRNKADNNGGVGTPQALLCLPIRNAHHAVIGVLQAITTGNPSSTSTDKPMVTPPSFTDTDISNLEFIAVAAGATIWNLVLSRQRQTAQHRIEGLLKLHRNISMESVSSSAVLDQVLAVCHELVGTERIGLFIKIEGEDELYIASASDIVRGEYVPITKGIAGYVARTGEMVITNDAYSHPLFDSTLDQKTGFLTKRILCLPVKSPEGTILAVLSAVNKVDGMDFTSEDAVFLNYAAEAVGTSLHKASLHREVRTSQKLIEARLKLTTFISESTDIAEFVDMVMELGKDIMECDRFGMLLIDHFKHELWITPRVGGESIRSPINRGISGLVATTGQTVCTRDAYKHELFDPSVDMKTGYRTTSVLCMPIFEDHSVTTPPKVVAVAMCINKKEGAHVVAFTKTDREIMSKYCAEVQFALGRLSLDISYYKVVSDCVAVARTSSIDSSSRALKRMSTTSRIDKFSETDIISSIVHKYCHSGDDNTSVTKKKGIPSFAALLPAIKKKNQEDDEVPFPREIFFAHGKDEPLDHWDTETMSLSSSEVSMSCGIIFRAYGFMDAFRISSEKFSAFTTNVANYYRSNPFHNFQHAFQVMVAMHIILRTECRRYFSGLEIFAMLVASLCHDIDHPGNTNDFELKMLSPMALTHNDDAVLERHHCRVTFIILNHKSAKMLQHLDRDRSKRVRQLIIACILATDMSKHFEKCKVLEGLTRRQLNDKRPVFMGILMHAADLSHYALPFAQTQEWGARLLDEFQNQAGVEAEHGVPTDFFMQHLENKRVRIIVQLNFINYVVRPIWLPLTSLCHHLRFYTDTLEKNYDMYRQQLDKERNVNTALSSVSTAPLSVATSPPQTTSRNTVISPRNAHNSS
ncbi:Dual 3',5'-cyclic-AMP and -GMP phosphodiesterase 11A [Phytophthora ramorum]|uniref:Dual 3',5'-cyclic-AMP and -GMP phosphodiesterase 11A n=1 Tax=Phytophthora ramorum TaxID=164328 RepID=UPI0030A158D0|nr:Dual 3',5'-cyclic-AMP and -GMP phosphodiesterase 11A [Phytophthora ramorum]